MLAHTSAQEEAKLAAMQRVWQGRRGLSSTSIFEEVDETEDLLSLPRQVSSMKYYLVLCANISLEVSRTRFRNES